jgi:hypothetical protein
LRLSRLLLWPTILALGVIGFGCAAAIALLA